MKAVVQELGSGLVSVTEAPAPAPASGHVSVRSHASLISAGTEGMLLEFGRSDLLDKLRSRPEKGREVLAKVGTDGLMPTLAAVRDKLREPITPGYCQAGVVLECGDAGAPFRLGDRVVTNGPHAEVVRVPYNLAARIPDGVGFEAAAFTPLAAIGLQGLRLAAPTLGETVVVFGLGLVGQLTVQIVQAQGCRCIGIDTDPDRVARAESFGASGLVAGRGSVVEAVRASTGGAGADAVLMTLASDSDEPVHQAAEMSRKRGRIVLVGVTGLDLRRADFYEKELSFQVSCSYGPGRYDPVYEEQGSDYPLPFVRWTEQRNFQAVLNLMAEGRLDTESLITHRYNVEEAPAAYDLLLGDEPSLGIVLTYAAVAEGTEPSRTLPLREAAGYEAGRGVAGVLGAGNFARRTLIPAIRSSGIRLQTIVSSGGLSAAVEGDRAGAAFASSDADAILSDPDIDTVFVLTRHDSHARLCVEALEAGKNVFVEKPLALTIEELDRVRRAVEAADRIVMVGFNRRFAPLATELKELVDRRTGPVSLVITVNAGRIDREHWTQDPRCGGGRIVGEACHFIDLARFLVGAPISGLSVQTALDGNEQPIDDVSHLSLGFADGSTAVVHYLATGSKRFPKERIEAFLDGRTAAIDNWRRLRTWGFGRRGRLFSRRLDKGHEAELEAFAAAVTGGGPSPIPFGEILEVSSWSIRAGRLARGEPATAD